MNTETDALIVPGQTAAGWPHLPEPRKNRWQLLRAGLQNIWEYDDQRFVFHHGRLLLRGRNESGKSKALEVLLPFLLDADLSPQRLDPFGTTSRPMYWNLINDQNPEVTVNIGYLWVEFGRRQGDQMEFRTVGAGLRAKRGAPGVDARYFITPLRVDRDWNPLGKDRIPVTPSRLGDILGPLGRVFDRSADYRREVNSVLFGMSDDQYGALIEALLELRRPQLSKRLDLPELSRVLSVSLPPLDPESIGRLAEGFERLDRLRDERNQLGHTSAAVEKFLQVYRKYLLSAAKGRSLEVSQAESEYQKGRTRLREAESRMEAAEGERARLLQQVSVLETSDVELTSKIEALKTSREYEAIQQLDRLAAQAEEALSEETRSRQKEDRARVEVERSRGERDKIRTEVEISAQALASQQRKTETTARDAGLEGPHSSIVRQLSEGGLQAARATGESIIDERKRAINDAERESEQVRQAHERVKWANDRRAEAENHVRERGERLRDCERDVEREEQAFTENASTWVDSTQALQLSKEDAEQLLATPVDQMRSYAEHAADERRGQISEELGQLLGEKKEVALAIDTHEQERRILESASHRRPTIADWRTPRSAEDEARAFYLLCEFKPEFGDPALRARLEAAMQASGLLDARLASDGEFIAPGCFDLLLESAPLPAGTRTLADVLMPAAEIPIPLQKISAILSSIEYRDSKVSARPEEPGSFWISSDGAFRAGPLRGAWQKPQAEFVGTAAREKARRKRLEELARVLLDLEGRQKSILTAVESQQVLLRGLASELDRFPSLLPLQQAGARAEAASRNLEEARTVLVDAENAAARAISGYNERKLRFEQVLVRNGLLAWSQSLPDLREKHRAFENSFKDLIQSAYVREQADRRLQAAQKAAIYFESRLNETQEDLARAAEKALKLRLQVTTLTSSIGADPKALLAQLQDFERDKRNTCEELKGRREKLALAEREFGAAGTETDGAKQSVERQESLRQASAQRFRGFASATLLDEAGIGLAELKTPGIDPDSANWTFTDTLQVARGVAAAASAVGGEIDEREKFENRVNQHHQDLIREFSGDIRLAAERTDETLIYSASYNGKVMSLSRLVAGLAEEMEARDRLLGEDERKVFESFLSGETHEHLRTRVREARKLVDRMNEVLLKCPTASGSLVRLKWDVTDTAPGETEQVIRLLLRAGNLLSDAERSGLRLFLSQRLQEARESDGAGGYHERMMKTLDYRSWFEFKIEYKDAGSTWKLLTRKRHGEGSGGKKAVMLHLPLFAAAAAFFESASPTSPRLILLDEAFAGIDPTVRGQLMAILSEFDLDFVMTSYEEWGFYAEIDGLSTYHLSREPGLKGVLAEWFLWDGGALVEMGT